MEPAIGLIEVVSIAQGIMVADQMAKKADVKIVEAHSICPGKFIVLITGDTGAVKDSVSRGIQVAKEYLVDHLIIPNVHSQVIPAIEGTNDIDTQKIDAIGVIEFFSAASCLVAADLSCKESDITLIEIRLGMGLGGKSFYVFTGPIGNVKSAATKGIEYGKSQGTLFNFIVIPAPNPQLWKKLI